MPTHNGSNFLRKVLTMASKSAITISKTSKAKILSKAKSNLAKDGQDMSLQTLLDNFSQAEVITDIITSEMIGSKNKYLIDLYEELGDNKE